MGVRILEGREGESIFYCSSTEWAFGPVMPSADVAEAFLRTFQRPDDPRQYKDADLERLWNKFRGVTESCPFGHFGKVDIENPAKGETYFTCYQKGCAAVWNAEGELLDNSEDEDDLTEAERLGEARVMR